MRRGDGPRGARLAVLSAALLGGCGIWAGDRAELEQLRAEELAKPVFRLVPWCTDFDRARASATREDKLIFAYFTRSYAG